jgi:hypothetical protein
MGRRGVAWRCDVVGGAANAPLVMERHTWPLWQPYAVTRMPGACQMSTHSGGLHDTHDARHTKRRVLGSLRKPLPGVYLYPGGSANSGSTESRRLGSHSVKAPGSDVCSRSLDRSTDRS